MPFPFQSHPGDKTPFGVFDPEIELFRMIYNGRVTAPSRFPDGGTKAAFAAYDNLHGSPYTTVRIPTNGGADFAEFSVASLAKLGGDLDGTSQRCREFIEQLVRDGWFTYTAPTLNEAAELQAVRLNPVGSGVVYPNLKRDGRFVDPSRCLKLPASYDTTDGQPWPATDSTACSANPAALDSAFPVASGYRVIFPTIKLTKPGETPDDAISQMMERACSLLNSYLRERNANPSFHPIAIAANQPTSIHTSGQDLYRFPAGNTDPATLSMVNGGRAVDLRVIRGWELPPGNVDPTNVTGWRINAGHSTWRESLRTRARVIRITGEDYSYGGRDLRAFEAADALTDFVAVVMLLSALLEIGDYSAWSQGAMVDCYATATAYNILQRSSYLQLGQPYGTNIAALSESLRAEAQARSNRRRSLPANTLGSSYASRGVDSEDISASIMAVASLALAGAAAGGWIGAIVGAVVGACIVIVQAIIGGEQTIVDPMDRTLRSGGSAAGTCFLGLSPRYVLNGWPIVRVR